MKNLTTKPETTKRLSSEEKLRAILDNLLDSIITINEKGIIIDSNPAVKKMFGYEAKELIGKNVCFLMPEPFSSAHNSYLKKYFKTGKAKVIGIGREVVAKRKDGSTFPIDLAVTEAKQDEGRYFIGRITDITERKEVETRLKLALEAGEIGLSTYDLVTETLFTDSKVAAFPGIDVEVHSEPIDSLIKRFVDHRDVNRLDEELKKALESGRLETEVRSIFSEEETKIISIKAIIEYDLQGAPIKIVSASHLYQSESDRAGYFDISTGIPSINLVMYEGKKVTLLPGENLGCLYISFNNKNNLISKVSGSKTNTLLKVVECLINSTIKKSLITGITIDRNFIVLWKVTSQQQCEKEVQEIIDIFKKPLELKDENIYVEMSAGVALSDHKSNIEILIENSMIAQKKARESLLDFTFYSRDIGEKEKRSLSLKDSLRVSFSENQFYLMYQPLVSMETGKIIGVEALSRLEHPKYGFVTPGEFIPLIENNIIVYDFGRRVLNMACRQNKAWQDEGLDPIYVSVNVTAKQLLDFNFISFVKEALDVSGLDAKYLKLEVTETGLISNPDKAKEIILELQKSNVNFLMDDFGTGYASLGYLYKFSFDGFKLDKSFIDGILENKAEYSIVSAAIGIAKALGIVVIAEGIEKHETYSLLNVMGCQVAQGYLISKPLDACDVSGFIRRYN